MTMPLKEATIVSGDDYDAKLVCQGPGDVVFILTIKDKICGHAPLDNLIKAATRIDPEHASAAEKQIKALREELAIVRGQIVDQQVLEMQRRNAERAQRMAEDEREKALSELAQVRKSISPQDHDETARKAVKFEMALREIVRHCHLCAGKGRLSSYIGSCTACAGAREVLGLSAAAVEDDSENTDDR